MQDSLDYKVNQKEYSEIYLKRRLLTVDSYGLAKLCCKSRFNNLIT